MRCGSIKIGSVSIVKLTRLVKAPLNLRHHDLSNQGKPQKVQSLLTFVLTLLSIIG
jgi:hypothetical protein